MLSQYSLEGTVLKKCYMFIVHVCYYVYNTSSVLRLPQLKLLRYRTLYILLIELWYFTSYGAFLTSRTNIANINRTLPHALYDYSHWRPLLSFLHVVCVGKSHLPKWTLPPPQFSQPSHSQHHHIATNHKFLAFITSPKKSSTGEPFANTFCPANDVNLANATPSHLFPPDRELVEWVVVVVENREESKELSEADDEYVEVWEEKKEEVNITKKGRATSQNFLPGSNNLIPYKKILTRKGRVWQFETYQSA